MNNPNHFIEWLDALLAERKQLRHLAHKRLVSLRHADSNKDVPALDKQIAELIEGPLSLSRREAPGVPSLVAVASSLLYNSYGSPETVDGPEYIWRGWGHANISTSAWPASLKERLQLLTAPLDKALAEILESYQASVRGLTRLNLPHHTLNSNSRSTTAKAT